MKSHERKKAFRVFCRNQARKGLANAADGSWYNVTGSYRGQTDRPGIELLAGYRVGQRK